MIADSDKKNESDCAVSSGGNQSWWSEFSQTWDRMDFYAFNHDQAFRMQKMGCGIIAMCDAELFLQMHAKNDAACTGQNVKFTPIWNDQGVILKNEYMKYIDDMRKTRYIMGGRAVQSLNRIPFWRFLLDRIDYNVGLNPIFKMEPEFKKFFRIIGMGKKKVKWARFFRKSKAGQKVSVLEEIRRMLTEQIPVICSYYVKPSKKEGDNKLSLYEIEPDGNVGRKCTDTNDHYMTIIGLYEKEEQRGKKAYCKVVSWGKLYYMDYDEYAESLSFFSNVLSVW